MTPQQADAARVHWLIGTTGTQIENYMQKYHPELGCSLEDPENGPGFLRAEIDSGHPVMVWFNMPDADSHWVGAAGHKATGTAEQVIVMSWGRYYAIHEQARGGVEAGLRNSQSPLRFARTGRHFFTEV